VRVSKLGAVEHKGCIDAVRAFGGFRRTRPAGISA